VAASRAIGITRRIFVAVYVLIGCAALVCRVAIAESLPPTVLILDDSDPDSPFGHRIREQIHATLDTEVTQGYAIYTEFLNIGHFRETNYDATLRAFIKDKYREKPMGVIIAIGSGAFKFSLGLRADVWPQVPIVFETFDETLSTRSIPPNTTGIIAPRKLADLVKSAQLVVPGLAQIVLVGDPINHQPYRKQYQRELPHYAKEFKLIDLTNLPLDDAKVHIASLPDHTAIIYIPIFSDESGKIHNPGEALEVIADVANRPIVVDASALIGKGATGGIVPSARELGEEAGHRAARILEGEAASAIPVETKDFSKPEFDARQLARWGVSEAALPAGSNIQFQKVSVWQRYWWQILIGVVVIILQGIVIIWLLWEHRRRQAAEREAHQHLLEVTKMDRAMTASAMSASVAHELNQPLSAILNNAETGEVLLKNNSLDRDELKNIFADIRHDDQRAVDIIKHMRALLKQDELAAAEIDLSKAINDTLRLIRSHAKKQGVRLEVAPIPPNIRVRADSVHVQQVILNLAMNAIDAMQNIPEDTRMLKLELARNDDHVIVSIADKGKGIPEDKLNSIFEPFVTTKEQGTGLGLSIAKTIINTYGGNIWAANATGGGATFHFTLKLAQP
jgi:signal transduction histidine kinase